MAQRWANMLKTSPRRNQDYHNAFDWWIAGHTQQHLDKIVNSMATTCAKLNAEKGFDIPPEWFLNVTRESLNRLHLKFHELAEVAPNDFEINQLNYIVHSAESCINNMHYKLNSSNLFVGFNIFDHEPLTPEDYLEFTEYVIAPGALTLSYATIGKNLYHCYNDNDIDLISAGMVRPKLTLTPAANCYLNGSNNYREPARYFKWCEDNNILGKYGYDCHDPLHSGGCCMIGTPTGWDGNEVTEWLIDSVGVHVHHWAIED